MSKSNPKGNFHRDWDTPREPRIKKPDKHKKSYLDDAEEEPDNDGEFFEWRKEDKEEEPKERQALSV